MIVIILKCHLNVKKSLGTIFHHSDHSIQVRPERYLSNPKYREKKTTKCHCVIRVNILLLSVYFSPENYSYQELFGMGSDLLLQTCQAQTRMFLQPCWTIPIHPSNRLEILKKSCCWSQSFTLECSKTKILIIC